MNLSQLVFNESFAMLIIHLYIMRWQIFTNMYLYRFADYTYINTKKNIY